MDLHRTVVNSHNLPTGVWQVAYTSRGAIRKEVGPGWCLC